MIAQVLDLTPSGAGWYYASAPAARVSLRVPPPPFAVGLTTEETPEVACLGYGPDGRMRLTACRPRFTFLA